MTRPACYVIAPYADESAVIRAWNVARGCALARLAVAEGLAPIVVHPGIVPIYGPVETSQLRALGLDVDTSLVELVARTVLGRLYVLETDAGELTSGSRRELVAFTNARGRFEGRRGTWASYRQVFRAKGLGGLWAALEAPPSAEDLEAWAKAMRPASAPVAVAGTVRVPFQVLDLIDKVYVPRNPAKIRAAAAEVVAAVKAWKVALTEARAERGQP